MEKKKTKGPTGPNSRRKNRTPTEKPTKIETNQNRLSFNYFGWFQLRILQTEYFSFSWLDKKKKKKKWPNRIGYSPNGASNLLLLSLKKKNKFYLFYYYFRRRRRRRRRVSNLIKMFCWIFHLYQTNKICELWISRIRSSVVQL